MSCPIDLGPGCAQPLEQRGTLSYWLIDLWAMAAMEPLQTRGQVTTTNPLVFHNMVTRSINQRATV